MAPAAIILWFVALQRGLELVYSARNTARIKQRGGIEFGRGHYPFIVLLHAAWLLAITVGITRDHVVRILPLLIFVVLQILRVWVIATLGSSWTTRVMSVPGEPLVRRGPYRLVRHPNYLIVIGEIATLPLVFGQVANAVVFSMFNLAMLVWRVRVENAALAARYKSSGRNFA
jgi:methyltransferase